MIITVRNLLEFSFDNSWLTSMFTLGPMTFPVGWPTEWASVHQLGTWMYGCLLFPLDTLVSLPMVLFHFLAFTVPQSAYTIISQPFAFSLDIDSYLWRVEALIIPALVVFGSEVLVDWLKHAFITKFNMIRPAVYGKYLDILCRDYLLGTTKDMTARTDDRLSRYGHPAVVSRRIGFASIPLACLVIRVFIQGFSASVMATCPVGATASLFRVEIMN